MATIVSRHIRKGKALEKARKLNENVRKRGKSSGWSKLDYRVDKTNGLIRKWVVKERSR